MKRREAKRQRGTRFTRGELFLIFLKAGLAFGGGLGILAVLEDELVYKRRAVTKEEFLTIYGIGRTVRNYVTPRFPQQFEQKRCAQRS